MWRSVGQLTQLALTLAPTGKQTRLVVTADRSRAAALVLFGSFAGWLMAAGITGAFTEPAGLQGVALILGALGAGGVTAQTLWRRATTALQARMARVERAVTAALGADEAGS